MIRAGDTATAFLKAVRTKEHEVVAGTGPRRITLEVDADILDFFEEIDRDVAATTRRLLQAYVEARKG